MQIDIKILKMSEIVMIIFSLTLTPPVFKQLYNRKDIGNEKNSIGFVEQEHCYWRSG